MLIRVVSGLAGVGLAVLLIAAGLRLLRRIEDAAAGAGVSEGAGAA
jgi:hypothetical protein